MQKIEIDQLIKYGEKLTAEFKEADQNLPKSVWETYGYLTKMKLFSCCISCCISCSVVVFSCCVEYQSEFNDLNFES